jgi:hypothetical protein
MDSDANFSSEGIDYLVVYSKAFDVNEAGQITNWDISFEHFAQYYMGMWISNGDSIYEDIQGAYRSIESNTRHLVTRGRPRADFIDAAESCSSLDSR